MGKHLHINWINMTGSENDCVGPSCIHMYSLLQKGTHFQVEGGHIAGKLDEHFPLLACPCFYFTSSLNRVG